MNAVNVKGLVIRTVDLHESDRLVTIFTEEMGVITAIAKGARSYRSRKLCATLQFCYTSFVLYQKGDYFWVKDADLLESFFDIRKSLEGLALASYIAEVIAHVAVAEPDIELLRLSLNSLYAIASGKYDLTKVKSGFEIRTCAILGFMPDVFACIDCGEKNGTFYLDIMGGFLRCYNCAEKLSKSVAVADDLRESRIVAILSEGAKSALLYCTHCPIEKIFSFNLSREDMSLFSKATEEYLVNQLERSFNTLEFYKDLAK